MSKDRKPFARIMRDRWIAGVCAGIAYSFKIPVILVRMVFILFVFILTDHWVKYIGYTLFLFYFLSWFFAPILDNELRDYKRRTS